MGNKLNSFADLAALTGRDLLPEQETSSDDENLVYSTDRGRISNKKSTDANKVLGDGNVRVSRTSKGRGGKTVTLVTGLPLNQTELTALLKKLKKQLGCGGAVKNDQLEFQGDRRDALLKHLSSAGYEAKLSGG
ncbi:translation initiation factor [Corallincola platygyrae]|uniref:Translation initiation factor n=1 Tax=Corallincola platygyrae TaxID=1193278 RepID=A0ABW4XJB8_9GAMM